LINTKSSDNWSYMFTHDFNVYETLAKLDGLLDSGHEDPSPMDRAEYKVLTDSLVQGAAELLRHLALHDVLALETADALEPISPRQVSTTDISDGAFSDEVVTIDLPPHLVPYGAIVESMKAWNLGTIETTADLVIVSRLWARFLQAQVDSDAASAIHEEWFRQAERISEQCLPTVQLLDAAGLLRVRDLRDGTYRLEITRLRELGGIELIISTEREARNAARTKPRRKKA
jgi:hypothetical protein